MNNSISWKDNKNQSILNKIISELEIVSGMYSDKFVSNKNDISLC